MVKGVYHTPDQKVDTRPDPKVDTPPDPEADTPLDPEADTPSTQRHLLKWVACILLECILVCKCLSPDKILIKILARIISINIIHGFWTALLLLVRHTGTSMDSNKCDNI